jgi:hypothetical protein
MAAQESSASPSPSPDGVSAHLLVAALRSDSRLGYGRVKSILDELATRAAHGTELPHLRAKLRALLLALSEHDLATRNAPVTIPKALAQRWVRQVARIRKLVQEEPPEFFSVENDLFIKYVGVCVGQLYPGGARLLDLRAGISRRLLLEQGIEFPFAATFFARAGGFAPFFETHMDPRDLSEFNEPGLIRMYVRAGFLLEANPHVRGVFGGSWFYDPALERLSPHLAYIQRLPRAHGAALFRTRPTAAIVEGALAKSRARRAAYEQNEYYPRAYLLVWLREDLLRWAARHRDLLGTDARYEGS